MRTVPSKSKQRSSVWLLTRHTMESTLNKSECGLLQGSVNCRCGVQFFEDGCGGVEGKEQRVGR